MTRTPRTLAANVPLALAALLYIAPAAGAQSVAVVAAPRARAIAAVAARPAAAAVCAAAAREYTKVINRRFPVESRGELVLDNRYGDIDLAIWERDEVEVSVTIVADASSEERAQRVFDRVEISFEGGPRRVAARTDIEQSGSSFWGWSWGGSSGQEFEINYRVSAPRGFAVDVTNRYGDVRVPDLATEARFDVSYGNLETGDVAGPTTLTLGYGEGVLGRLAALEADVKYSQLKIAAATVVSLDSKYSETTLGHADRLALDSQYDEFAFGYIGELTNEGRYDDFRIDSVGSLTVGTRYTDFHIGWLGEAARMRMRYGDARFDAVSMGFTSLDLEGEYTDFSLDLSRELPFRLEGEGRYVEFELPDYLEALRREHAGTSSSYSGHNGVNPQGRVVLAANYGSVRIR